MQHIRRLLALPEMSEATWLDDRVLFGLAAIRGFADAAGRLMDETDASERLRPLREALRYHASDRRNGLRKLAPEVWTATRAILKSCDTELPLELGLNESAERASSSAPSPATKRATRRSRAKGTA